MSSKSNSASTSSSSNISQDNRVAASEQAVALGQSASLQITNEFSNTVAEAYKELVDLVRGTVQGAGDVIKESVTKSLDSAQRQTSGALDAVNAAGARASQGQMSLLADLAPWGVAALALIFLLKKR